MVNIETQEVTVLRAKQKNAKFREGRSDLMAFKRKLQALRFGLGVEHLGVSEN